MLSLSTVRRVCAAIDAVSATIIAAGFSKSRTKTDLSVAASCSIQDPNTIPTIASCKAALLKQETKTKPEENTIPVSEPALIKIKKERDPEKLFHLFKSNAHNRLVVENRFAFEDTVSRSLF